jgi:uncharacterized protein YkwD
LSGKSTVLQVTCIAFSLFISSVVLAVALEKISAEQVLAEINLARTEPLKYAGFLREFRRQFSGDGNSYSVPGSNISIQTIEGIAAVDEAIDFLTRQKPLAPLIWSAKLAAAAGELVEEQGKSGATGHDAGPGGGLLQRSKKNGIGTTRIGENTAYGPDSPRGVVIELLIDDGVASRGHRKNQFDPAYKKAGVSCGPHPRYETMCVIDFSGRFRESIAPVKIKPMRKKKVKDKGTD